MARGFRNESASPIYRFYAFGHITVSFVVLQIALSKYGAEPASKMILCQFVTKCQSCPFRPCVTPISLTSNSFSGTALCLSGFGDELHALGNNVRPGVFHQKVRVVGRHHVIEHRKTKKFLGLEKPPQVTRRSRAPKEIELPVGSTPQCFERSEAIEIPLMVSSSNHRNELNSLNPLSVCSHAIYAIFYYRINTLR